MKVKALTLVLLSAAHWVALSLPVSAQYVTVGNPGNPNDPDLGTIFPGVEYTYHGAVAYTYAIGTYEVTLNQYTAFLNAVAASDPFALYNPSMGTDLNSAGISRTGSNGSYVYGVIGDGARPVTYVSFYDAMRYANWLGTGNTETGAYTLLGGTPEPSNGLTVTRNSGAQVWIPSTDEWYKAAYYDPTPGAGGGDNYWLYPTQSDTVPNSRNGSTTDANSANFYRDDSLPNGFNGGYAVTDSTIYSLSQNYLTPVGSFTQADSYYGTFDQGGNVREWNDTIDGASRIVSGGSALGFEVNLRATVRGALSPTLENVNIGFRVATVPEPTVAVSLLMTGAWLLTRRKRALAV